MRKTRVGRDAYVLDMEPGVKEPWWVSRICKEVEIEDELYCFAVDKAWPKVRYGEIIKALLDEDGEIVQYVVVEDGHEKEQVLNVLREQGPVVVETLIGHDGVFNDISSISISF